MKRRLTTCLLIVLTASILGGGTALGADNPPLWEQTFNFLPNYDQGGIYAVAATATTVIVCGSAAKSTQDPDPPYSYHQNSLGFIRAYDIATGNPKWQGVPMTLATDTNATNNMNYFNSIMLNGNIALVLGHAISITSSPTGSTTNLDKSVLRAYNADTGALLWEDTRDGGSYNMAGSNSPATMANNRVFVSGFNQLNSNIFVRSYKINTSLSALPLLLD